jgi:hypothetical protein
VAASSTPRPTRTALSSSSVRSRARIECARRSSAVAGEARCAKESAPRSASALVARGTTTRCVRGDAGRSKAAARAARNK